MASTTTGSKKAGTKADALIDNLKPADAQPDQASADTTEQPTRTRE